MGLNPSWRSHQPWSGVLTTTAMDRARLIVEGDRGGGGVGGRGGRRCTGGGRRGAGSGIPKVV